MCTVETKNRATVPESYCGCSVAEEDALETIFAGAFEGYDTAGVGLGEVYAILRKLCICFYMGSIDNLESLFFGTPCGRITDVDTLFSAGITFDIHGPVGRLFL